MCITQIKNGIMINADVNAKNHFIGGFVNIISML